MVTVIGVSLSVTHARFERSAFLYAGMIAGRLEVVKSTWALAAQLLFVSCPAFSNSFFLCGYMTALDEVSPSKSVSSVWCPGRDLNPHSPYGKTDFKSVASADFEIGRAHV